VSRAFFDTNILIYQLDKRDVKKRALARDLFKQKAIAGDAVISTQVLQEFYVAATVKLHVDPLLVKSIIHMFENMEVVVVGKDLINEAVDASLQYKLSFWDSLIVVSAESAKCESLYTEDLNAGQIIRTVKIINPLKSAATS
jgi:predicted nucleic acid-binding protein